jgi:pimeloyl-ACP methyl ester carboxylesterase
MQVVVDGLLVNYQKTGKGKIILCLHGWGDSSQTFSALAAQLDKKYSLLMPDLPGFGGSQVPNEAWGLDDYARFITEWLKKIGVSQVHGVIGHSFGGSVAIVGLGTNKLKADKLILLAASGVRQKQSFRRKVLWLGAKVLKIPLYLLPASKAQKLKVFLYKKAGSDLLLIPHMRQTFVKFVSQDVQGTARSISQPCLLIYGSKDKETPVAYGQLLNKAIAGSQLEIVDDAGHFLHQEQAEEVAALIDDFLSSTKVTEDA